MPHGLPDFWQGTIAGMPTIGAGQVAWYQSDAKLVGVESYKDLINYVVPDTFELHVCSGVVSCEFPILQNYDLRQTPAATWISPIAHIDPDNKWNDEEEAYDNNLATLANTYIPAGSWSPFLILLVNETFINKIRFYASYYALSAHKVDIDAWYEGDWHGVFEGEYADRVWLEKALDATELVSKARIRVYNRHPTGEVGVALFEFQFNTSGVIPQKGIWFDTHSIIPYLPQAPYIVEPRATFAVRVSNTDLVAHNMSVSLAGFLQKKTM